METLLQDLRYGVRMLGKKPAFSAIAVLTLALGIGATTAIFTVVNAVVLRPLPYPDADRLIAIGQQFQAGSMGNAGEPKFLFWREQSELFEAMAAYSAFGGAGGNLAGGSEAEYVSGVRASADLFRVLGVYPALGREFTEAEDTHGGDRVAILSDGLWRRRFGADKELIGRSVLLNDKPVTVVGVMPPNFRLGFGVDLFVPMRARPTANYDPNATVVGRLKPGVTLQQADAELKVIADKYRAAMPRHMQEGETIGAQQYKDVFTSDITGWLWLLLGAVGFLLLIACANVANLQLMRAAGRKREMAVRMALGASGKRIVRQLLTEGVLLSLVGAAAGLLLAAWGTDFLLAAAPRGLLPSIATVELDGRVLAFAFGVAVLTGLLFGLAPAWQARKVNVNETLKEQSGRGGSTRGRLRGALVITELALSLVLLVGAGLLIRTFANLKNVPLGFDAHNVLTSQIALNGARYDTTSEAATFYHNALERIGNLPGVESAAIINKLPLDWQFNMPVVFPDRPDQVESVQFRMISPEYFNVMKISVRRGRVFTDADTAGAAPVAIVNEAFEHRFFDGKDTFAQRLSVGRGYDDPARQVIGVVADAKQYGLDRPSPSTVFVPIPQMNDKLMAGVRSFTSAHFVVRTAVPPLSLREAVKREIAGLDSTLPLAEIHSMEEIAAVSVASRRFNMLLIGVFAALGMLLAAVGIYGVISYSVAQRTSEIGIRIALGARSADVVRMILKQGMVLALAGVAIGIAGALALTRLMKTLLFGVTATDPLTFTVIAAVLTLVALLACYIPARRATRVDPMVALRCE
jgi:putative ABC transport system permease protein